MSQLSPRPICILLGAVCTSATLATEPPSPADTLDAVKVNAYRPAQSISSASKTHAPLGQTPQSVSVIAREELDMRGVQNLSEATRYNAGMLPESSGIDNRVDDIYIRGFDAGSWGMNLLLDGMRGPSDGVSSWNKASFNAWNMERVEVLKGPSSVLYGQLAPGGVINQISKTPQPGQAQVLQLTVDGNGRHQTAFDAGAAWNDDALAARLVGLYSDGESELKHNRYEQWFLAPGATFRFNDGDTRLTVLGLYQVNDGGSPFQFLPYQGTLIPGAEGYIKQRTWLGEPHWNLYERTIWNASWLFEHAINGHWTLAQNARHTHMDSLYRGVVTMGQRGATGLNPIIMPDGRTLPRRAVQSTGDSDTDTLDTRLEGRFNAGTATHTVLFGVDWQRTKWWTRFQGAAVSPWDIAIDIYDPVYTGYDFASVLTEQLAIDETDRQLGAYLQEQLQIGRWHLTFGGRHDRASIRSFDRIRGLRVKTEPHQFSGRAGVLYQTDSGFSPYLSYSESFQPASGITREGAAFAPVLGMQWETGIKYEPANIDGMLTVSVYELRQQNVLTADPRNQAGENFQVQTGEVRVRGAELEGRVTPLPGFSLIGALTRLDSEVTRNNDGNQGHRMPRVADWMGSLWLDYTFGSGALGGLGVAAGMRHVGSTFGDLGNTLSIPGYTLFDAALRYDLGRARLALNAHNLADRAYIATCTAVTTCNYGYGRALVANVRFAW